jgi:hypothetical protein
MMTKQSSRHLIRITLLGLLIFTACEKDHFKVEGKITNIADIAVKSASVILYTQGTDNVLYSTACDSDGMYSIEVLEGYYDIRVNAEGYLESEVSLKLKDNLTQDFVLKGKASLHGSIIDAQTGSGIDSVNIGFTRDTLVTDVYSTVLVISTDYLGNFSLDSCPTGTFRIVIETPVYFQRVLENVIISEGENNLGDIALIEPPDETAYRIVLTWGFAPTDLDAHFTGPDGSGSNFHICYWNHSTENISAQIDRDDSWRYGPETITIHEFNEGIYRYSVHNYTDQSENGGTGIAESPARVEIYGNNDLIQTFMAPTFNNSTGNTWRVFELECSGGLIEIVPVNTYLFAEDDADLSVFKLFSK